MVQILKLNSIKQLQRNFPKANELNNNSKTSSEQIEEGSGCVATIGSINTKNINESQKDLNMQDVLNSSMVNKALELFQPETQTRLKPKV